MAMKIIITIPAYNEEKNIGGVIKNIKEAMNKEDYKILVVNDGSTDNTEQIAKDSGAIVYSNQIKRGLAQTFRTEIKKCIELKADIIVHIDADGQYLAKEIPKLINEVKDGYDLVLGSRFKGKIEYMPLIKKIGNIAFSKVISKIIGFKVSDCQTGFRAFNRKVAEEINIISDHTYTQEQIIKAVKMNFKVKDVPVYFAKRDGQSRLIKNPLEYAVKAWINIFRTYRDYEPLKFFMKMGFLFLIPGFLIGLYLVYLFINSGRIGHIPLTILSVLLIIIGIQIISFGFLADMNKK